MTPEQKRAMEHYSPRIKGPGGKTLKYDRDDDQLRREQKLKNYMQSLFNKRASATSRNQVYAQSASSGQAATQMAAMTLLSRDYQIMKAAVRNQFLGADVRSGAYARNATLMGGQDRQKQLLEARGRNMAAQQDLETGATVKHAEALSKLDRQLASIQMRGKIQILSSDLKSGAFLKNAQEVAQLNKELRNLENQARLQTLVAEHGVFGGVVRANERSLRYLAGTAVGAFNSVKGFGLGLMHAGLAGTMEGYQLSVAWQRLGQQAAGIAVPAINSVAKAVGGVVQWFRSLNGEQQRMIMYFGLAAVAIGPLVRMATMLFTVMRAFGTLGATISAASGLGLGLGARTVAATAAANAAASSTMVAGMSASGQAAAQGGLLGAAGVVGASRFSRYARFGLTRVLPVAAIAKLGYDTFNGPGEGQMSYYGMHRAMGASRAAAAFGGLGNQLADYMHQFGSLFGISSGEEYRRQVEAKFRPHFKGGRAEEAPKPRTDVNPMNIELLEGGGSAGKVQEAVLKHGMGPGEGEKTIDDLINFLAGPINMILNRLGLPPTPPMRGT